MLSVNVQQINGHIRYGSELILFMYRIFVVLILLGLTWIVLSTLWKMIRKPISSLFPVRQRRVEIRYMIPGENFSVFQHLDLVCVRYLDANLLKKRKFWMWAAGLKEGDQGILTYQGVVGLDFKYETTALKDQISIYQKYDFAKKKKQDSLEKEGKKRVRSKRKYW